VTNENVLLHRGEKFQSTGLGKFVKDILPQGLFVHPETGQIVDYSDPKRLERLAENTARYRRAGNKVPFPDGHRFDAMSNLGDWDDQFIVRDGKLWGMVNPRGKDVEQRLASGRIDSVSAYIERDVKDSLGNHYPEVITHICATDYPVIPGQGGFKAVAMSRGGAELPLFLSKELAEGMSPEGAGSRSTKEGVMDPKKLALALGLAETATADEIQAAAAKAGEAVKLAVTKKTADEAAAVALAAELKSQGLELKDGKVVKLSTEAPTARERELEARLAAMELSTAKEKLASAKAKAETYIKAGLVPPAQAAALSKLFALKDRVEALALSADGKGITGEPVDVVGTLDEILKNVRSIAGVTLSRFKPAEGGQQKEKSADELHKEGAALARELEGTKSETA
jgi:hypothetical protein